MFMVAKSFIQDTSGAAAAEYAVLVALIVAAVVAAINVFTPALTTAFANVGTTLGNCSSGKAC